MCGEASNSVKACPKCGLEVISECWHDGLEVFAVAMSRFDAQDLRRRWIYQLLTEAVQYADQLPVIEGLNTVLSQVNS
jgi:hypothetical protein